MNIAIFSGVSSETIPKYFCGLSRYNKYVFKDGNETLFDIEVLINKSEKKVMTKNTLSQTSEIQQLITHQVSPSFNTKNKLLTTDNNYLICYDKQNGVLFDLASNAFLFDEVITK